MIRGPYFRTPRRVRMAKVDYRMPEGGLPSWRPPHPDGKTPGKRPDIVADQKAGKIKQQYRLETNLIQI